ncbi:AfsR/SARP family transcriptional regulator [Paractinoplanes deccanensis]|uniref:AfsR/SARP family transcriptional regulator n=1 Tax=Paractinoplanes deccanensis TaxID=113561 RepID=UPI0019450940|nr:AfsR/SARP family transcriptional regulator [Actinoplanes deccanensis]
MGATTLRFSILGPVRVRNGTVDLELGGRQQRLLLALLLARAGSVVGLGELVDAIWGDDPPASAVNSIHRAVGTLRRLIEPNLPVRAVGEHLVRHSAGYRLEVDEDALDLLRFRSLVRRARQAAGDAEAVHHYAEALALWQGPPAAGLEPVSRTHPAFIALEAELAQTVREAGDVALRSGGSRLLLPTLRRIAGWRPFDEALLARVMLALAAEGRQAEALDAYQEVRRRLADELGLDPGPELRQARDRVLRGLAETEPVHEEAAAPTRFVPAQLPGDHPYYTGRADVLARAEAILADDRRQGRPTVALAFDGMPGVGKTTFAVHLAHRLAPSYPDGQLYVDLRGYAPEGPMTPAEALRGFLSSLGVRGEDRPAELHAAAGLFRSLLAGRRMLIVLDNARDFEQVRHLLPGTGGSLVLVTSRARLTDLITAGAHPLPIELPSSAEARDNLVSRLGRARVEAEPTAVQAIIERCARHPLALAMVAARAMALPDTPLTEIAADLTGDRERLDGFDGGLAAIFSWSYRALSPAAARLFRLLPVYPGPDITVDVAAALAGTDERTARSLLGELAAQMLTQVRGGRHQLHDLLRAYAWGLSEAEDPPPSRDAAAARLYEHLGWVDQPSRTISAARSAIA